MKYNIEVITEFCNRKSSENIVGWNTIQKSLAVAINSIEREIPLIGKWIQHKNIVVCPSCHEENSVKKERFFFYCQQCGRKVAK